MGGILHFDGQSWRQMYAATTGDFCGVGGTSPTDVFAVGFGGMVLHYAGPPG
jgi:hypothetical protein